ncbi:hypothetical protein [Methanocaldococcus infernus]|uniref:Multiple resistance and pH regulation protein F n=1 Tax=Methanocaldococcus infernus (strain DSM 11812 / JCM 15783 / ME) TaxID=573063 RepID=D5VR73_METIM|nr:hypothetical protein [Methanocaldococcus infernus]ADG13076.1 conserved hypothetical protein [Methanocaldococcus infernus ME]
MNPYIIIFAILSLTFSALTGLRLAFKKETSNVLIGEGIITVTVGTLIVLLSKIYNIPFAGSIALAIIICGAVGTLAFCKVIGGDNEKR